MPLLRAGSAPGCRLRVPRSAAGGPAGLSLRSQLPRPPTKMKRKGMGRGGSGEERLLPPLQGCWDGKRGQGAPGRFLGTRSGRWVSLKGFGWWRGGVLWKGDCLPLILNYEGLKIVLEGQSVLQLLGRRNC